METADGQSPAGSLQGGRGSADVHAGSGSRNYQLPQRFRAKRERNRQFHGNKETGGGGMRDDVNLNSLLANKHGLPIPFPASPGPVVQGPLGRGVLMLPTTNGHMLAKIGPYKEPLLPGGPPPPLLQHHGGLNLGSLTFAAHQANMKAAMHTMSILSPNRRDFEFKMPSRPPESPKPAYSVTDMHKARIHSRSESASSVGSLGSIHDASLKKLMKDLHRCEVSISRYQTMLNEHCDAGLRFLHQAFITLHIGLNARERDLARELQMTRYTAGTILQHRHSTATVLRQLGERADELEEAQLHELKKQIKQFVTDRKVDEEIGTTSRFIADPDDLLPRIMTFGRVVNRRHVYTSWEGNPAAAVERSKHNNRSSVFSSPASSSPTTPSPIDTDDHTNTTTASTTNTTSATTATNTTSKAAQSSSQESLDQKMDDSVFGAPDLESEGVDGERGTEEQVDEQEGITTTTREEGENVDKDELIKDDVVCVESPCNERNTAPLDSNQVDQDGKKQANEDNADSSSPSSVSLTCPPSSTSPSKPASSATNADPGAAKSSSANPPSHKGRSSFSRKFAAPIVVTHTRRSFAKTLPKNLDPKSTVTLLLSSSLQQKHKHRNQKTIKPQFSPSRHFGNVTLEENVGGTRGERLRGREKEKELWRKRFNSSSSRGVREQRKSSESGEEGGKAKRSPEELSTIQSRVRESLRAQGVFLYDPVTGSIPINQSSRGESDGSGVEKTETATDSKTSLELKKKTPTQLRRERKKRQKERERRQKELERRALEAEGEKEGRVALLDKTSANRSASTSRTASPLSSIGNSTSDTRTESASLSLSQSPLPPTDEETGEQGGKSLDGGEVESGGGVQSAEGVVIGAYIEQGVSREAADSKTFVSIENIAVNKSTSRLQHHTPDVKIAETATTAGKREERFSGPSRASLRDSATIEWDMSQKRQERVAVGRGLPQRPSMSGLRSREKSHRKSKCSSRREELNGYVTIHQNPPASPCSIGYDDSISECSPETDPRCTTLNSSPLQHNINPPSSPISQNSSPSHSSLPASQLGTCPLSLHPSLSPTSSSNHNTAKTISPSFSIPNSDAHILEPSSPGEPTDLLCISSKLERNADSSQSIVMNGHEE